MSVPIQLILSAGGWAGCAVSIYFNARQHYRPKHQKQDARQEKTEHQRKSKKRGTSNAEENRLLPSSTSVGWIRGVQAWALLYAR
jgi:hypothetical protein